MTVAIAPGGAVAFLWPSRRVGHITASTQSKIEIISLNGNPQRYSTEQAVPFLTPEADRQTDGPAQDPLFLPLASYRDATICPRSHPSVLRQSANPLPPLARIRLRAERNLHTKKEANSTHNGCRTYQLTKCRLFHLDPGRRGVHERGCGSDLQSAICLSPFTNRSSRQHPTDHARCSAAEKHRVVHEAF